MPLSFFFGFPLFDSLLPLSAPPSLGPNQSSVVGKEPIVCGAISCGSGKSYLHVDEKKKNRLAEEEYEREKNHTEKEKPRRRRESDCDFLEIAIYRAKRETEKESRSISGNTKNPPAASADGLFQPGGFWFDAISKRRSVLVSFPLVKV